ncbi:MAG TPA: RNA polymerase factor sigma-54 [Gemmataceae bacterium]|nr:RNA polymerase factor sigma-54 [Gemmataceae bacterium]
MQPSISMQLNQRMEQRMLLSPRMIQSMEILQLPILALEERISQEMEENPVLELLEKAKNETPEAEEDKQAEEKEIDPDGPLVIEEDGELDFNRLEALNKDWEDHFNEEHRPSRNGVEEESDRKHDAMQNMPAPAPTLQDHLLEQISFLDVDPEQHELLEYLISHLDDNGYLVEHEPSLHVLDLEELAKKYTKPVTAAEMQGALDLIQRLDPPGVGARSLEECLLLQLKPDTPQRDIVRTLIMQHLEDIEHNRMPVIQRQTGYSLAAIQHGIETIRHFNPKPGAKFSAENTQYVTPDIIVERNDSGDYDVRLADDWMPNLYIPRHWYEKYKNPNTDAATKKYLKDKLQSAEWLYNAIRQRRNTLIKVTKAIIKHQRAFLDQGPDFIEPLKMQQIADQVGVHVTTVSRAVDDKWVLTPRGVFPLKRFFGGGKKNEMTGEEFAWETIKNKLLELIADEDKSNPLSDEELVEKLQQSGYPVARRTVTKYRKMLDIPSSRQRKDWTK